jgi:hypothetical protein
MRNKLIHNLHYKQQTEGIRANSNNQATAARRDSERLRFEKALGIPFHSSDVLLRD